MKSWLKFTFVMMGVAFYVACSNVKFDAKPSSDCKDFDENVGNGACVVNPQTGYQDFSYSLRMGQVDILFVTDNSGSMYAEQKEMSNRFPNLLDPIRGVDYQIAIVTTDIPSPNNNQPNAANGNGEFWDGKFLKFPNGSTILSNSADNNSTHTSNISHFQSTIERDESKNCDQNNFQGCGSGDERAIMAVNRAMERSENSTFFRNNGHLAVVILSDEDERSTGGESRGDRTSQVSGRPLETNDYPSSLVQNAALKMGATKTMSVHSVIIQPKESASSDPEGNVDTLCKSKQDAQGNGSLFGQYGDLYYELSHPSSSLLNSAKAGREAAGPILMEGTSHSICLNNYTVVMQDIAKYLKEAPLQIPCTPKQGSLQITTTPEIPGLSYSLDENNRVVFSQSVVGKEVHVKYSCPRI